MTSLSRSIFESNAKVVRSGADTYATIDLYVPAFERSFEVEVHLAIGATAASDRTLHTLGEIAKLSPEARSQIRSLLYADALRAKEDVAFGDPSPPKEASPAGFIRSIFWRPNKYRFVALALDDPRHPCYLPGGADIVESKIEWVGIRVDENESAKNRFSLLDLRPAWEEEHGATVVIRNGLPIAIDTHDADIRKYDDD